MFDIKVVVEEIRGFCDLPMKVGDYFEVKGGRIIIPPEKHMCLWALQSMMPLLPLKQRKFDETNDWVSETSRVCCPDPNGQVIFRIIPKGNEAGSVSSRQRIKVDSSKCSGCRSCELACSFAHTHQFNLAESRIRVHKDETVGVDEPKVCRQCGNARCIEACPTGALYREKPLGPVVLDEDKCIKCHKCIKACPFGAVPVNTDALPRICDLCGDEPECVKRCSTKAIQFE
jgi:carbon-monoxide dehydrogenase iron sulfur subunit